MSVWDLSDREWDVYELRFSTAKQDGLSQCHDQLRSGAGRSKPSIADDLGCSVGTVELVRKAYRQRGLARRRPISRRGASRGRRRSF